MQKPQVIWKAAGAGHFTPGRKYPISEITFHHIVGDAGAAIARFQNPDNQVASHYVIGSDGTIYQMVADGDTAHTNGNFDSNSRSITIEHAGGHSSVPYTELMYSSASRLVAWLISEYKINTFRRHREIVSTACPGDLNVERIVNKAKELLVPMTDQSIKLVFMAAGASDADASKVDFNYYRANPDKLGPNIWNSTWNDAFRKRALAGDPEAAAKLEQVKNIVNQ